MRPVVLKFIAMVLLALQSMGSLVPGGAMLCTNPDGCRIPGCIPLWMESQEPGCECCGCCEDGEHEGVPAHAPQPFGTPCGCCITLPPIALQLRVESDKTWRELERALDWPAPAVEVAVHPSVSEWAGRFRPDVWSLPPPDRPARLIAVGLTTTRLII